MCGGCSTQHAPEFDKALVERHFKGIAVRKFCWRRFEAIKGPAVAATGSVLDLAVGTRTWRRSVSAVLRLAGRCRPFRPALVEQARAKGRRPPGGVGSARISSAPRWAHPHHLALAADVLCIAATAAPIATAVAKVLAPGGLFALGGRDRRSRRAVAGHACVTPHGAAHLPLRVVESWAGTPAIERTASTRN